MPYKILGDQVYNQAIDETSSIQNAPLGSTVLAVDIDTNITNTYIYAIGVDSTVANDNVYVDASAFTTLRAVENISTGLFCTAMSANVANQYGWYRIEPVTHKGLISKTWVTSAEIENMHSTPVTVVPAVPEFAIMFKWAALGHPAGTAYIATDNIQFAHGGEVVSGNLPCTGWLDQAGAQASAQVVPIVAGAVPANGALSIKTSTTNPTAGTFGLNVLVEYDLIPQAYMVADNTPA